MSNNTACDYCSCAALRQKYGTRLIVQPCAGTLGGTNVYWGKADERHFLAWFLELTPVCTCRGRDAALAAHR
jgi:hypothetical protein